MVSWCSWFCPPSGTCSPGWSCQCHHCRCLGEHAILLPVCLCLPQELGGESYLTAAERCGEVVWSRGLLKKGYGLCHGVGGNGFTFLQLYRLTGQPHHLHRAIRVGSTSPLFVLLAHFSKNVDVLLAHFSKNVDLCLHSLLNGV